MSAGLIFVRADYLSIGRGIFLPYADIIADIFYKAAEAQLRNSRTAKYVPNLKATDFYFTYTPEHFALFISTEQKSYLPTWGADDKSLATWLDRNLISLADVDEVVEFSNTPLAKEIFRQLDFAPGPALLGRRAEGYTPEAKALNEASAASAAQVIIEWADRRRAIVEESKIFLSHKSVDKHIVTPVYETLRLLGLNPWLDVIDAERGKPLARVLDTSVDASSMTVFFISSSFVDDGFIGVEIDRALHKRVETPDFRILPLVLLDHGAKWANVPRSLSHLIGSSVRDCEIVLEILKHLPPTLRPVVKHRLA